MKTLKDYTDAELQRELRNRAEIRAEIATKKVQWISPQEFLPTDAELACEPVLILQYDSNGNPVVEIGEYGDPYGRDYNYWLNQWGNDLTDPEDAAKPDVKGWLPLPKDPKVYPVYHLKPLPEPLSKT
jgi:hypothetical protein